MLKLWLFPYISRKWEFSDCTKFCTFGRQLVFRPKKITAIFWGGRWGQYLPQEHRGLKKKRESDNLPTDTANFLVIGHYGCSKFWFHPEISPQNVSFQVQVLHLSTKIFRQEEGFPTTFTHPKIQGTQLPLPSPVTLPVPNLSGHRVQINFAQTAQFYDDFTWRRNAVYRVRQKKVDPYIFSPFSQQPFGILIWNFTALFTETFYI